MVETTSAGPVLCVVQLSACLLCWRLTRPRQEYHPDDIKGKGEPSYSIEKALKERKMLGNKGRSGGIELQDRPATTIDPNGHAEVPTPQSEAVVASAVTRSGNNKRHGFDGLKKRIGSLRRKKDQD